MKIMSGILSFTFLTFFAVTAIADELSDTHENRLSAAERYLEIYSTKDLIADIIREMSKNLPVSQRDRFSNLVNDAIRLEVIDRAIVSSMVKHFTLSEIDALTDFYGSPEGRSIMDKFGLYMADVMPIIEQESLRAVQEIESEF